MGVNSSGEELVIKTRKPYTITKQRERWTEEEHNRFLEALRLYGRAWQKIEEHVGTKTAVQIRSHAQKFFSKLEKEAHAKGIPVGQALDIDIPPPRPKRKPCNPYPRKPGNGNATLYVVAKDGKPVTSVSSVRWKETLELGKGSLPEKPDEERQPSRPGINQGDNRSDCFAHFQEAHCNNVSSVDKISILTAAPANSCSFMEFLPSQENVSQDNGTKKASNPENYCDLHGTSVQGLVRDNVNGTSPIDEQEPQTYSRHVPVQVLDGSSISCALSSPSTMQSQDPLIRPMESSSHQTFPAFHPAVTPLPQTPDHCQSFANLITSTLSRNPAVHAAASFAASFWPHNPTGSSTCTEGRLNSPPSLAAISAATVAAATAWWATHGLLPLCPPFHSAFPCHPQSTTSVPSDNNGHAAAAKVDRKETTLRNSSLQNQELDPEHSEASEAERSASKSTSSPSDSEESESAKLKGGPIPICPEDPAAETDPNGSSVTKNRKQADRSSSGSNAPSSSDVEVDPSEKPEKGEDEVKEIDADAIPSATESSTRRTRSSNNLNESWKAVSEEGRLAFEALFSRKVLPQSFSPPHDMKNDGKQKQNTDEKKSINTEHEVALVLDLNSNAQAAASDHQVDKRNASSNVESAGEERFLAIGLGTAKLKERKTGFKPYKRCSVEAKEGRTINALSVTHVEQKDPKRIRLESEAST